MKITDIYGKEIEVTHLKKAIAQADYFKDCHHEPPEPIADERQQTYWMDVYDKLVALQNKLNANTHNKI